MEITQRPRRSPFIRYFDKTPPGIVCPHFYILAHANGCLYECAYCYLQLTFRGKVRPVVFSNRDDLVREVREFLTRPEAAVLNAGELADSLSTDAKTGLTRDLVPLFATQDRHLLVLLTKSTFIDNLLRLDPRDRTVVSFSLNAVKVAALYEKGAPSPQERVAAAVQLRRAGYRIRFRLDPLIPIPGWEEEYEAILQYAVDAAQPERVTLGSLRFFPNVRSYARLLGRNEDVFRFAPERCRADGRFRLPTPQRIEAYRRLLSLLPPEVSFGLCKETEECVRAVGIEHPVCNCTL